MFAKKMVSILMALSLLLLSMLPFCGCSVVLNNKVEEELSREMAELKSSYEEKETDSDSETTSMEEHENEMEIVSMEAIEQDVVEVSSDKTHSESSSNQQINVKPVKRFEVTIDSFRLANGFRGSNVVIIKYIFKNLNSAPTSFFFAYDATVYQDGVSLNPTSVFDKDAHYDQSNQTKKVKKGVTLEVEVAYELNDTTADLDVELKERPSLENPFKTETIQKTFRLK